MTMMAPGTRVRAGAGYWLVAVLSLLWNAMGAIDFTLTAVRLPAYVSQIPPDMMDWLDETPVWALAFWGLGTLGALAGSLALLARSRLAVPAFALSLAGLAGVEYWQQLAGLPESLKGTGNTIFSIMLWVVAIGLLAFSIVKARQGVLR